MADDGHLIFDGSTRSRVVSQDNKLKGIAFVPKKMEEAEQRQLAQNWVGSLVSRFRPLIATVLIVTLIFNLLSLATPFFIKAIYDTVIPSESLKQLWYLLSGVAFAVVLETVFRQLRVMAMAHFAGRVDYIVGRASFERVLMVPLSMIEHEPLGTQIAQLQDFETIRELFAGLLGETLLDLPFVLIFFAAVAFLGGWLVLIPVVALLLFTMTALILWLVGRNRTVSSEKSKLSRYQVETISSMRAIKFSGAEEAWLNRHREFSAAGAMQDFATRHSANMNQTFARLVSTSATISMMGFGAFSVMQETMTVGALIACSALLWRALTPMQTAYLMAPRIPEVNSSIRQLAFLMRLPPERDRGRIPFESKLKGRVVFNGVSHRFSADADAALAGLTFTIEPGEVVAITGPNGAGKSTLLNLLSGLYRTSLGTILIDGVDVRQIDPIQLRQSIAHMPQDVELFYGTVEQNLRLAEPTVLDRDIEAATRLANVHDDILSLPEGFDTRLSERILNELPEGFKQRLALARTYLRKSPIMLLDEPGQALDSVGDQAFIDAIKQLRGKTTIFIVTHRPSHIKLADRVLLINRGRFQFNGSAQEFIGRMGDQAA
ncbi:MAG: peptidase domain-containing ABC transporter [Alphaproteobacteria bacterium]|nr:peptidase domain-containing ABC transporter [Alphaproteobacteria bacterium]